MIKNLCTFVLGIALLSPIVSAETDIQSGIQLTPVVLHPNGFPKLFTRKQAVQHCKKQGTRLPTLFELLLAFNPEGISTKPAEGFSRYNPVGEFGFYYDFRVNQFSGTNPNYIWSSSRIEPFSYMEDYKYFGLDGTMVLSCTDSSHLAVRCIQKAGI